MQHAYPVRVAFQVCRRIRPSNRCPAQVQLNRDQGRIRVLNNYVVGYVPVNRLELVLVVVDGKYHALTGAETARVIERTTTLIKPLSAGELFRRRDTPDNIFL